MANIAEDIIPPDGTYDNTKLKEHLHENIPASGVFSVPTISQQYVQKELSSLDLTKAAGLDTVTRQNCFEFQYQFYPALLQKYSA